jgi:excisionase family DNA binding protein
VSLAASPLPPEFDPLLTLAEVARRLRICSRGVWRLVARGELPAPVKVGSAARWLESEVRMYLEKIKKERNP